MLFTGAITHHFFESHYIQKHKDFISKQLDLLKYTIEQRKLELTNVCKIYLNADQYRLTVISDKGDIVCDSFADPKKMNNHLDRPEIKAALSNAFGQSIRFSETLNSDLIYIAKKITIHNEVYVLRQAIEINELNIVFYKIMKSLSLLLIPLLIILSICTIFLLNYFSKKKDSKLSKMKKDLFYNIAHEVKTPLTSIKGYLQAIELNYPQILPEIKALLDRVQSNAQRLDRLFEDILSIASLESKVKNKYEDIDVKKFSEVSISNFIAKYDKKKLNIEVQTDFEMIYTDYSLLEYIFNNLIDNAIKYSDKYPRVSVRWFKRKNHLCLEVRDYGKGISENHQKQIFERFFRGDLSRSDTICGTGLGLSIVKHAAKQLNAQVELTSTLGSGSSFIIVFTS